jgi:hypothetical protein
MILFVERLIWEEHLRDEAVVLCFYLEMNVRGPVAYGKRPGLSFFSVQPLRFLCLCVSVCREFLNHRDTENASEVVQRIR